MSRTQMNRRRWGAAVIGSAIVGWAATAPVGQALASTWPERPVKVVVPAPAGSSLDVIVRLLGDRLKERWGQPLVVENKAGAGGMLGMDVVAKAAPDGYTLGLVVNSFSMNPSLYKGVADPLKAFDALGLVARGSMVLVARPALGATSLQKLVEVAKAKADGLTYATPGNGSPQHLATALLGQAASLQLLHVPYRGSGPAVTAALSGEVDLMFMPVHTAVPFVKEGKLRALMVSTRQRSPRLPEVPTAVELGIQGFDVDLWYAVVAPAGLPADVAKRLQAEVQAALGSPAVAGGFEGQGLEPIYLAPEAFNNLLRTDIARWAAVIRSARITGD